MSNTAGESLDRHLGTLEQTQTIRNLSLQDRNYSSLAMELFSHLTHSWALVEVTTIVRTLWRLLPLQT